MKKRYFHILYQWSSDARGGVEATVAIPDDGSSTEEMYKIAIEKLREHLGERVKILRYNKLPSNYKPRGDEID